MAERGLKQIEVSRGSGVGQGLLSRYLAGKKKTISVDTIEKLSVFFGIRLLEDALPPTTESLDRYLESVYAKDDKVTDEEIVHLRRLGGAFVGPDDSDPNPRAWSKLLEAIRMRSS
jgi:transcriptional regulator with XRE-family HTH domain